MCVEYYYIDAFLKRFSTKFSKNLVIWKKIFERISKISSVSSSNLETILERIRTSFMENRFDSLGNDFFLEYHKAKKKKFSKFFSHAQISPISIVDFFPQKRKGGTVSRIDNRPFRTSVTRVPFGHPRRWLAFYDSLRFPSRLSACKRHRSD